MTRTVRLAAACIAALLYTSAARAHDFWLEPGSFRVARGETVELSLQYGEEYEGKIAPRDNFLIEKFVLIGPDGTEPVPGQDKQEMAGRVTLPKEGLYLVAYRGKRRPIRLEAARFEAYLKAEGLEHVSRLRSERKETHKGASEVYSRCAKTLLESGGGATEGHDRIAGLRLEIVPETNPYRVTAGADLTFRVLFEGKPLAKGLVIARSRAEPKHTVAARTDAEGRVRLTLDRAGEWLVKCTHMVAAPEELGMDWESLWASLTFELPAPTGSGVKKQ
ncbi:MAG TPA: DUF4198 domain-containing protein [Archangium sp.]|nr:DUF4198 domain-containing protein [Archangium sp.]